MLNLLPNRTWHNAEGTRLSGNKTVLAGGKGQNRGQIDAGRSDAEYDF